MQFVKMHGLGNDYVFVDCFQQQITQPQELACVVSDRHKGVGGDGLILIQPSMVADAKMVVFNADGSRAEMCGNGIRCVGKYIWEHRKVPEADRRRLPQLDSEPLPNPSGEKPVLLGASRLGLQAFDLAVETDVGVRRLVLFADADGIVRQVRVEMGKPRLRPTEIPVLLEGENVVEVPIDVGGRRFLMTCVSMGNPHAVVFVEDLASVEINKTGPAFERHRLFPRRVNVHFARVVDRHAVQVITWERGSGPTQACGTGACAVCAAGVLTGRTERRILVHLPGGVLAVNWSQDEDCIYMTGEAVEVFTGQWPQGG